MAKGSESSAPGRWEDTTVCSPYLESEGFVRGHNESTFWHPGHGIVDLFYVDDS